MARQTFEQTDIQTDKQSEGEKFKQTNGQSNSQTDRIKKFFGSFRPIGEALEIWLVIESASMYLRPASI